MIIISMTSLYLNDIFTSLPITWEAKHSLKEHFKEKNVLYVEELLSHDGYDRYGPESNIWSLYIYVVEGDKINEYRYSREVWFTAGDDKFYHGGFSQIIKDENRIEQIKKHSFALQNNKPTYVSKFCSMTPY